ncbi:hypothetical protein D3C86_1754040 [compost metagenome]
MCGYWPTSPRSWSSCPRSCLISCCSTQESRPISKSVSAPMWFAEWLKGMLTLAFAVDQWPWEILSFCLTDRTIWLSWSARAIPWPFMPALLSKTPWPSIILGFPRSPHSIPSCAKTRKSTARNCASDPMCRHSMRRSVWCNSVLDWRCFRLKRSHDMPSCSTCASSP